MNPAATADPTAGTERRLPVSEVFHSIQGEGVLIGRPSTFIRLTGCNYTCTWCDTPYTWKPGQIRPPLMTSVADLAAQVQHGAVVITGGEPLLHDLAPLLAALPGKHVTIETNASKVAGYPEVDLWSLSPKLASSGHHPDLAVIRHYLSLAPQGVQLKFVIGADADLAEAQATLAALPESRLVPVILQPVTAPAFDRNTYMDYFAEWALAIAADPFWQDYRLQLLPQLHRLCWPDREGI
ncbi:MAG: 7-carboxy-7-deazaguanine synthase QueE [Candidatus Sericytochromatia bacterium]|nr:7-carboxy-7-deazaguanine synthase QueE [Candidatus Sericytochromatia bacterium]